jgi:hypothetical protein
MSGHAEGSSLGWSPEEVRMSTTFVISLIVAAIVVVNWRLFVLAAATLALALMVTATSAVSTAISGQQANAVVAPAQPGVAPAQSGQPDLSGEAISKAEPPG